MIDQISRHAERIGKNICENEKIEKFVSGVAPHIVNAGVTFASGSPGLGTAAGAVTSGFSRSHSKDVAVFTTAVAVGAACAAASVVATPVIALAWAFGAFSEKK